MYFLWSKFYSLFYLSSLFSAGRIASVESNSFSRSILFNYYDGTGDIVQVLTMNNITKHDKTICDPNNEYALITHGWTESCNENWVLKLVGNLNKHRGGCIVCMDYGKFSKNNYFTLVSEFREIKSVLISKLRFLSELGFQPQKAYLFGFSFGAHLVMEAAEAIGVQQYQQIDVCDMAGPGFDNKRIYRGAAKNVQCIHTSRDRGTSNYNGCHQNWRMGLCGVRQTGAQRPPLGSHGLCPVYYNLAFDHSFLAVKNLMNCSSEHEVTTWPNDFKMGYLETRKGQVQGELFVRTVATYPYVDDGKKHGYVDDYDDVGNNLIDWSDIQDESFFNYNPVLYDNSLPTAERWRAVGFNLTTGTSANKINLGLTTLQQDTTTETTSDGSGQSTIIETEQITGMTSITTTVTDPDVITETIGIYDSTVASETDFEATFSTIGIISTTEAGSAETYSTVTDVDASTENEVTDSNTLSTVTDMETTYSSDILDTEEYSTIPDIGTTATNVATDSDTISTVTDIGLIPETLESRLYLSDSDTEGTTKFAETENTTSTTLGATDSTTEFEDFSTVTEISAEKDTTDYTTESITETGTAELEAVTSGTTFGLSEETLYTTSITESTTEEVEEVSTSEGQETDSTSEGDGTDSTSEGGETISTTVTNDESSTETTTVAANENEIFSTVVPESDAKTETESSEVVEYFTVGATEAETTLKTETETYFTVTDAATTTPVIVLSSIN